MTAQSIQETWFPNNKTPPLEGIFLTPFTSSLYFNPTINLKKTKIID